MKHRKLRIAWSLAWGIVALLVGLWVRSSRISDIVFIPISSPPSAIIASAPGEICVGIDKTYSGGSEWETEETELMRLPSRTPHAKYFIGNWGRFAYINDAGGAAVLIPDWFLIFAATAFSAAPPVRWSNRFTLRTLLVATTLVAIGLGLIVWLANK